MKLSKLFKNISIRILILTISLLISFIIIEFSLRLGAFNQLKSDSPTWIPPKYRDIDRLIDLNNYKFSKGNPYGFTDIKRTKIKKEGTKRIAILGDSFVWGDGLPYDQTWSHKLSEMIRNNGYDNYEVMSCGRNGWSTKDELNWLVDHGFDYEIDFLILAWTANDLDFGNIPQRYPQWQNASVFESIEKYFPYSFEFTSSSINNIIIKGSKDYGYINWERKLYDPENLKRYKILMGKFKYNVDINNCRKIIFMTPNNSSSRFRELFDNVTPIFDSLKLEYYNIYPEVKNEFNGRSTRSLWANHADGHPGQEMTSFYSRKMFDYLVREKIIMN